MIQVLGRDVYLEAYRVAVEVDGRRVLAMVPERHFGDPRTALRPSHQQAYEGIAAAKTRIEQAVIRIAHGRAPGAPFDDITLAREEPR